MAGRLSYVVVTLVARRVHNLQVGDAVVATVLIDVMNNASVPSECGNCSAAVCARPRSSTLLSQEGSLVVSETRRLSDGCRGHYAVLLGRSRRHGRSKWGGNRRSRSSPSQR